MLDSLQKGACPENINDLVGLNNSQLSRNTRGANLTILPRRYNRVKEGGRTTFVKNVEINALYKHLKLSQFKDRILIPFFR